MTMILPTDWGFPRVRGDVPGSIQLAGAAQMFSPRARGCSLAFGTPGWKAWVFPACAGMFR